MDAGFHDFECDVVGGAVSDDYGDVYHFEEFGESESADAAGFVACRGYCRLDDEDVCAGVDGEGCELLGVCWGNGDGASGAAFFDLPYSLSDQIFLDWGGVDSLEGLGHFILGGVYDLIEHFLWVVVFGVDAFQIQRCESALSVEFDGGFGRYDGIHGGGDDGRGEGHAVEVELDVGEFGVDGDCAWGDGDFVEPVGASDFFEGACVHWQGDLALGRVRFARLYGIAYPGTTFFGTGIVRWTPGLWYAIRYRRNRRGRAMAVDVQDVLKANIVLLGVGLLTKSEELDAFRDAVDTEVEIGPNLFLGGPLPNIEASGMVTLNRDRILVHVFPSRSTIAREYPSFEDLGRLAEVAGYAIAKTDLEDRRPQAFGYNIELVYDQDSGLPAVRYLADRLFAAEISGNEGWQLIGGAGRLVFDEDGKPRSITIEPRFDDRAATKISMSLNVHENEQRLPDEGEIKDALEETWRQAHEFVNRLDEIK